MTILERRTSEVVKNIERYERNWHIFKAVLFAIGLLAIIIIQFYTYNQLLNNSTKNRVLLHCSLTAINTQSPRQAHNLINKCLQQDNQ